MVCTIISGKIPQFRENLCVCVFLFFLSFSFFLVWEETHPHVPNLLFVLQIERNREKENIRKSEWASECVCVCVCVFLRRVLALLQFCCCFCCLKFAILCLATFVVYCFGWLQIPHFVICNFLLLPVLLLLLLHLGSSPPLHWDLLLQETVLNRMFFFHWLCVVAVAEDVTSVHLAYCREDWSIADADVGMT